MISDKDLEEKIKRHHRRKSKNLMRYFANQFSVDHIIWRSLCAMQVQRRIEKDQHRFLQFDDFVWLLAIKQYVIETGKDKFFRKTVRNFINFNFKQSKSSLTAIRRFERLEKSGFLYRDTVNGSKKYMMTMKSRAFFRDLNDLFKI